jgi:hypothetical protein
MNIIPINLMISRIFISYSHIYKKTRKFHCRITLLPELAGGHYGAVPQSGLPISSSVQATSSSIGWLGLLPQYGSLFPLPVRFMSITASLILPVYNSQFINNALAFPI